ncbi:MAG TPA: hypothetical protein PKW21_07700 [Rhabdaerophilum sp.]|nr:hypothetical protein [Rhabdaerophilum sp.]
MKKEGRPNKGGDHDFLSDFPKKVNVPRLCRTWGAKAPKRVLRKQTLLKTGCVAFATLNLGDVIG